MTATRILATVLILAIAAVGVASGAVVRQDSSGRFDQLTQPRPGAVIHTEGLPLANLDPDDVLRKGWDQLAESRGAGWRTWIDERTGLPTLTLVRGVRWVENEGSSTSTKFDLDKLAARALRFLEDQRALLGNHERRLRLDRVASGPTGENAGLIRFVQVEDGVSVETAYLDFHVAHGNLVAFGSRNWAPLRISSVPGLDAGEARRLLDRYVRPTTDDGIVDLGAPELILIPVNADPSVRTAWRGIRGEGIAHRLIWRLRFTDREGIATWTGEIDAHDGQVVAFYDDTQYDRIKGHVHPISDDGQCDAGGCARPDYPLPFVDYTEDGGAVEYANQHGLYSCDSPGSTIETTLSGQYFRINDQCGAIAETTTCDQELDLGVADDINCGVAAGASAGNTDAARSAYFSLSNVNRKARFWMPATPWLDGQVECRTNTGSGCNASWGGGVIFMQRAGNGCGNTGQLQGLVTHEWGHGIDHNDGGDADNPSEAYADIVAVLEARESCIARGFDMTQNCSGYGDTCLNCMGLREMDWDARAAHTPATPGGFLSTYCNGGGGPCGKEVHCESHLTSEAIFDLATRDLPTMGLDPDSAWQLTERLWYQSRPGSGGDAYNCSATEWDSCSVGSWYHQLRVQDDDDGDLTNGTPHAAAIFAAFDRHEIACGGVGDSENQNTSSCPVLTAPNSTFTAQTNSITLDWGPVTDAAGYRVYRNEIGCDRAQFPVVETDSATTDYQDSGLANGLPVFYRVQAIGANSACESPVSSCIEAAPQQLAGKLRFQQPAYNCSDSVTLEVADLNHPSASITVTIVSDTETTPETVVLNETSPGSARFTGSIPSVDSAPAPDGLISVTHGDLMVAEYIDLDDGEGGINVPQQATAMADCLGPVHTLVEVTTITESGATIDWTTSKSTTGVLTWGTTPALGNVIQRSIPATDHTAEIGPFTECSRVYFRITSTDAVGLTTVADVEGSPFGFNAYQVQGTLYQDGFETDLGWTLEGEWEIGVPLGLGSSPGDPTSANEGSRVLGHDLSGQGAAIGDYEFNTTQSATSPIIDASATTNVELRFDRWLNYHSSSTVAIDVKDSNGVWQSVWTGTGGLTDTAWTDRAYDVSAWAAGNPNFQVRFFNNARFGIDAGWNVDRMSLRDTDLPVYGACGGCAGAPAFAGAVSVVDNSPCADTGVTVAWAPGPAWGTGVAGTYAVYRDTVPGFTPSLANLVAAGVATTSWNDAAAPADVDLYYVVRAENDETCAGGPNNGGMTDANLAYAVGVNASSNQPPPGAVGPTLVLTGVNATDVRLDWATAIDAVGYNVYRSSSPVSGFTMIAQPTATNYEDAGALVDGQTWYYEIVATNACGEESSE